MEIRQNKKYNSQNRTELEYLDTEICCHFFKNWQKLDKKLQ